MIGGIVLDPSALADLAERRTPYANQVIDTAISHLRVVCVPAAALLECWAVTEEAAQAFLAMFSGLPVVVIDALDEAAAIDAGALAAAPGVADVPAVVLHAVHVARTRRWPVLTADPRTVHKLDSGVLVESLA